MYIISPEAVPVTIKEEKSSAVEFRVTVPVLVKSPETVREDVSPIVRVLPVATVSDLAAASVLVDIKGSLVNVPSITTISLLVGAAPVLQFDTSAQSLLVVPVQLHGDTQLKVTSITDPSPLPSSQSQVASAFVQTEINPVVDVTDTPV